RLGQQKWTDAIPEEQKALQHLLRAEATFRQIEVAFGSGGGGGGGGAGRDLARPFDLGLDTAKNQYETRQAASSAHQRAHDINDALKKLDELARRQEQLAGAQRNQTPGVEQRWQQEMLQREAEQLQKQLEQLTQAGASRGASSATSQGSSSQSAESSQSSQGASGSPNAQGTDQRTRSQQQAGQQALDRLRQAQEEMRRAATDPQAASDARLAAERLREAISLLGGMQSQVATGRLGSMSKEAD